MNNRKKQTCVRALQVILRCTHETLIEKHMNDFDLQVIQKSKQNFEFQNFQIRIKLMTFKQKVENNTKKIK